MEPEKLKRFKNMTSPVKAAAEACKKMSVFMNLALGALQVTLKKDADSASSSAFLTGDNMKESWYQAYSFYRRVSRRASSQWDTGLHKERFQQGSASEGLLLQLCKMVEKLRSMEDPLDLVSNDIRRATSIVRMSKAVDKLIADLRSGRNTGEVEIPEGISTEDFLDMLKLKAGIGGGVRGTSFVNPSSYKALDAGPTSMEQAIGLMQNPNAGPGCGDPSCLACTMVAGMSGLLSGLSNFPDSDIDLENPSGRPLRKPTTH